MPLPFQKGRLTAYFCIMFNDPRNSLLIHPLVDKDVYFLILFVAKLEICLIELVCNESLTQFLTFLLCSVKLFVLLPALYCFFFINHPAILFPSKLII